MTGKELVVAYKNGVRAFSSADLRGTDLRGTDLRGAYLRSADLDGAYLRSADLRGTDLSVANLRGTDLRGTDLRGTDLRGTDLRGADLHGADLHGADLHGADLRGTDLSGADLGDQWIVQGPARSDGYFFFLMRLTNEAEPKIRAGCRWLTMSEAREHWQATRGGTQLGAETMAILDYLETAARIRGLK